MPVLQRRRRRVAAATLWLGASQLACMQAQAERRRPDETGGMLLGWRVADDIVITDLIGPGANAVYRRDRFEPDGRWQQGQLERAYRDSARTVTFLGDWHSHPRGPRRPSRRDRDTAAAVASAASARAPQPVTLILARRRRGGWLAHPYLLAGGDLLAIRLQSYDSV